MLKTELHAHTADDRRDRIPHTTRQLIDHAATLGYGAIAITLHDRQLDPTPHLAYARDRGIVLIRGIERTIARRHLLLINFPPETERVRTFEELAALKRRTNGLVIVPHPFYPIPTAMGRLLDEHLDMIDAIEWNAMYTRSIDFNRDAKKWADANGKPVVGNTDLHLLTQMGTTWTEVDAEPDADAICEAIRAGRVQLRTQPLPLPRAVWLFTRMVIAGLPRGPEKHQGRHPIDRDDGE